MARRKEPTNDPGVPDEVAEMLAKIMEQQAGEKSLREQYYQELQARVDQAPEEQKKPKRPSHLRLVKRGAPSTTRQPKPPAHSPEEAGAHLLEWAQEIPGISEMLEDFNHHVRLFEQLVAARKEAGVTLEEMARRMSMPRAAVERLEIGDGDPSFSMIEQYVSALGKRIEWRFV